MEGRGAWLRVGDTSDVRIHAAQFSESDEGLVLVGSASHNTHETDDFVADYKARACATAVVGALRSALLC